jgi:uncharacterized protein
VKDGFIRCTVKRFAWVRYAVDLWITRKVMVLKGEEKFELRGHCNRCGRCCEYPTIQMSDITFHMKRFKTCIIWWQQTVNGFVLDKENKLDATLTFTCTHYCDDTGQCDSYASRPGMCRDYPVGQIYSVNPTFFEECGFYAVDKRAASFRKALEKTELPPDKREDLYKRLHLKE